jgi:hypothetical protein
MNTPKKTKRFDLELWKSEYWQMPLKGSGQFGLALDCPKVGPQFALLVSEFTHLEFAMERILGVLLRVDDATAAHVMRSIVSAKARIEMMQAVLERARHTATYPKEFDEILVEFSGINRERNHLVHARWYTDTNTGTVYIIRPNDDPLLLDMQAMTEIKESDLKVIRDRIIELWKKISFELAKHYETLPPKE